MTLKEVLERMGVEVLDSHATPTGTQQIGIRYKGRRTSVIGKSAGEIMVKVTKRIFEWTAEDKGLSREVGTMLADDAIHKAIMEAQKNNP